MKRVDTIDNPSRLVDIAINQSPDSSPSKPINSTAPDPAQDTGDDLEGNDERGKWDHPAEFVLSCLGYAVGLGNVWRFPYLVYANGGGAFLIPYLLMMGLVGLPLFFMEMIVGQYSASGPIHIWAISPLFQGLGVGMVVITAITMINYNMVLGWALYYMFASWQTNLPWYDCSNSYNTPNCYTNREASICEDLSNNSTTIWYNKTCLNITSLPNDPSCDQISSSWNATQQQAAASSYNQSRDFLTSTVFEPAGEVWFNDSSLFGNETDKFNCLKKLITSRRIGASEEYFRFRVQGVSSSIEETGAVQYEMVLILLLAWIVCYLCVLKGIKSAGKVVYVTATFPYLILIILFFRGIFLKGASKGIYFYIYPEWATLTSAKVWVDAAGQVFYSLSIGQGGLMTFASYNKFNNNVYRDTLIVVILDAATSIFSGFVIFSIIGHLADALNKEVADVITSGSALAFVAYPEVITYMQPPQLWSTLFFIMIITLGIDTQNASVETVMTGITDSYPGSRRWKPLVSAAICIFHFLIGLPLCTQAGVYWMELINYYAAGWSLVLIGLFEAIVFGWFYGSRKLVLLYKEMTGTVLNKIWLVLWSWVCPSLIAAILIFNIYDFTPLLYNGIEFPGWAQFIGWGMALISIIFVPVCAVVVYLKSFEYPEYNGFSFGKRLFRLTQPRSDWMGAIDKIKFQALSKMEGNLNLSFQEEKTTDLNKENILPGINQL